MDTSACWMSAAGIQTSVRPSRSSLPLTPAKQQIDRVADTHCYLLPTTSPFLLRQPATDHFHEKMGCLYSHAAGSTHSPMLGSVYRPVYFCSYPNSCMLSHLMGCLSQRGAGH